LEVPTRSHPGASSFQFGACATEVRRRAAALRWNLCRRRIKRLSDRLHSLNGKVPYYYKLKYGLSLGCQRTTGDADAGLYSTGAPVTGSRTGSLDSSAY
jgi:hypothetical protein